MKKFTLLTLLLLIVTATTCFASSDDIKVYVDNKLLEFDVQPTIVDGRTMVPMRKIFEELGADVQWDGETKTITGTKEDTTIIMQIDNKEMTVNDESVTLDVPPFVTNGSTLVPVRAIAESSVRVFICIITISPYLQRNGATLKEWPHQVKIDFSFC